MVWPMTQFLHDGAAGAPRRLLLAHGAGAPMDSGFMDTFAGLLAERGFRVARFEFAYMAARRQGTRHPPPRAEKLMQEYEAAIAALGAGAPLHIGGKSLGGRVASLVAQGQHDKGAVSGLVCLGYPFHPPGRPANPRTAHLLDMTCPAFIAQGERDPFGGRDEIPAYGLPRSIALHWAADGDHDLAPRKSSGLAARDTWRSAADAIASWAASL